MEIVLNPDTPATTLERQPHLKTEGLGLRREGRWLFRGMNMVLPRGSVVAITGPSGTGKSSLLSCLTGLLKPDEGAICYTCAQKCSHDATDFQHHLGIVFQDLRLVGNSSLLANVLCGKLGHYPWWRTLFHFPKADREAARELLQGLGLGALANRRAGQVSGGEQQRAALARALFQNPEVIIADEPVSHLDAENCRMILNRLRKEAHEHGRTVLCVLHDAALVGEFADYELVLGDQFPEGWRWKRVHA